MLKRYGVHHLVSDRYAAEWPKEAFRKHGITCVPSERTKSVLYLELLPLINARRVELLDNARLLTQLATLERRTGRSGKDAIDHAPDAHDDVANAAAGAIIATRVHLGRLMLPASFAACWRAQSVPSFSAAWCYLFGLGTYLPSGDACCKACPGHQFAKDPW